MQKEKKDKHFIKKPVYEGGPSALKSFIARNLRYPDSARSKGIEGTVTVRYTIDQSGKVIDAKIIAGLEHACDEEAIRLVKLLTFTVPKQLTKHIVFHKTIHIHFRPPKAIKKKVTYSYQVTSKSKANEKSPEKGYSYSIILKGHKKLHK